MRQNLKAALLAILVLNAGGTLLAEETKTVTKAEVRLLDTIKYLADDSLKGRDIGTEGIAKAGDYLVNEFKKMGLQTDVFAGSPYQEFKVKAQVEMGELEQNRLVFVGPEIDDEKSYDDESDDDQSSDNDVEKDGDDVAVGNRFQRIDFELDSDFSPLALGSSGEFDAKLAFVGYGITSEKIGYDDYADMNVEGKAVIILRKEPQQDDPQSKFDGRRSSLHATFRRKAQNAVQHGAAAIILVNDRLSPEAQKQTLAPQARRMGQAIESALNELKEVEDKTTAEFASRLEVMSNQVERLRELQDEMNERNYDPILGFRGAGTQSESPVPVFFVTREKIDKLLKDARTDTTLSKIEAGIDEDLIPRSFDIEGWDAQGAAKVVQKRTEVRNVVAVLDGEGPLADETIVIGAHYDHVGMGGQGTLAPWTVDVHNGADDNASGTSTLLEVARRFANRESKPKRRLVFIAFTGEEKGLLGSKHYVEHPRFPLDKTIAMLNLDMVGRLRDEKLTVQGTGSAEEFDELVDRLNEGYEFDLKKEPSGFGPSDHDSFYRGKVPVLFLFTGLHSDYHRPGDDWEKINVKGMRRITNFAVEIVDAIDFNDDRPTYKAPSRRTARRGRNRLILGVIPEMDTEEEAGLVLRQISEEGPAEKAGMKPGDIVTALGGESVKSLQDLRAAIGKQKADEPVEVQLIRGGKNKTVTVKLQKAG